MMNLGSHKRLGGSNEPDRKQTMRPMSTLTRFFGIKPPTAIEASVPPPSKKGGLPLAIGVQAPFSLCLSDR